MFRRYPYPGCLILALVLWALAWRADHRHQQRLEPASIVAAIQEDISGRERNLDEFLADGPALHHVLYNTVPDSLFNRLRHESFYLFAYYGDTLTYWNDDDLLAPYDERPDTSGHFTRINNNYCIRKAYRYPGNRLLIALLPISASYPFENEYLRTSFDGLEEVPEGIELYGAPLNGSFPIYSRQGKYWFSISVPRTDTTLLEPDLPTKACTILAMLVSVFWLQLLLFRLTRRHSLFWGFAATAALIVALRATFYFVPMPFRMNELGVFSPLIYGYSKLIPSLGDLLLNELCLLWLVGYLLVETPYKSYFANSGNRAFRVLSTVLFTALLLWLNTGAWRIVHSLVTDSQVSFNVSHLHNIDVYTVIALICIAIGVAVTEMTVRFINAQLRQLVPRSWLKQLLVTGAGVLTLLIFARGNLFLYNSIFWLTVYMLLLDRWSDKSFMKFPSIPMIFLSLFTCAIITVNLHLLIRQRDLEKDRVAYATHLLARQDPLMEYNFKRIAAQIYRDRNVSRFFAKPTPAARDQLTGRLNAFYLSDLQNRYQPRLYLYDLQHRALFNPDIVPYASHNEAFAAGQPTEDSNLIFSEHAECSNYLAKLSFDSGVIFITIAAKKMINESVYPELLQPATINWAEREGRYAYALYVHGKLVTQTDNYSFPPTLHTRFKSLPGKSYNRQTNELTYQETPDSAVIVAGNSSSWLSAAILLSYLFWTYLVLVVAAVFYQGLFRIITQEQVAVYHFTLKRRINLSMQGIVLVSFFIVGIVTIAFFSQRYRKARKEHVQAATRTIARFIGNELIGQDGVNSYTSIDSMATTPEFHAAISSLAANQKTDVNLFDAHGLLLVATQEELYNQGLLAPVMQPEAYRRLSAGSAITESLEYVGNFQYLSCYVPLKNDNGLTLGYVSVPFFSSEKDLKDELSNIIVALVNIYALLFLLSSLSALLITSRLTRTFNIVMSRFSNLTLEQNELIDWPYNDEIGLLINEYNKMARKVEENAVQMARNERESAWREMAKQVAHEIKNPLTPMKLNIQYLQSALKSKRPDIEQLAERVSTSIIEQIDNLTYIASEFSNFAKLPEANGVPVDLNRMLGNAAALFEKEPDISVDFIGPGQVVTVLADKSQLMRVFTNLLQNAVQAVQTTRRQGAIIVSLGIMGDDAKIAIRDNGEGIADDVAERIFKPYFTTKTSGTGLGLAMTKKIIEVWKGRIWFESAKGEGTVFHVLLPLYRQEPGQVT